MTAVQPDPEQVLVDARWDRETGTWAVTVCSGGRPLCWRRGFAGRELAEGWGWRQVNPDEELEDLRAAVAEYERLLDEMEEGSQP